MIKGLITLIYHFTNELPLNSIYIFIDIMLLLIIILLLKYKNKSRDYKIYNFTMNTIIIVLYFIVFILLLLYIRYIRWGFTFDLNLMYTKASLLVENKPLYHITTILLILLIGYLLLLHSKNYMIRCFIKRYLYYYYSKKNQTHLKFMKNNPGKHYDQLVIKYPFFLQWIFNLENTWSYDYRIKIFLLYNIEVPYCILAETKIYPRWLQNLVKFMPIFMRLLPLLFLLCIFFYECYCNNFVLHYVFYYLPFFATSQLYIKITTFLSQTDTILNRIIYERYYEEDNILYINTTDEEDNFILTYISNGFKSYTVGLSADTDEMLIFKINAIHTYILNILVTRRFTRIEANSTLFGNSLGQQCDSNNNVVEKIYD